MKYIKEMMMLLFIVILGAVGYMAVQRYYAQQAGVKVQFLDFDGDHNHRSSYDQGFDEGYQKGLRECRRERNDDSL